MGLVMLGRQKYLQLSH